jgi:hypothetical protein
MFITAAKRVGYNSDCTIAGYLDCTTAANSFAGSAFGSSTRPRSTARFVALVECTVDYNFEFAGFYCCSINLTSTLGCITGHTTGNCFGHTPDCNCNSAELVELVLHRLSHSRSSLLHRLEKLVTAMF